jgi:hypothetical protein
MMMCVTRRDDGARNGAEITFGGDIRIFDSACPVRFSFPLTPALSRGHGQPAGLELALALVLARKSAAV